MRRVKDQRLSIADANRLLTVDMEPAFWQAIVGLINYPELAFDVGSQCIVFPDYVPFRELASEWIEGIESGIHDVRLCERCAKYFDVNRTDGIYTNPRDLAGFLCMPCAETLTARQYFEEYLKT